MESLKRVGELINKCIKSGVRINTPDNDILEYRYVNKDKNIDIIGASYHPDERSEGININDFGNAKVEEEMFGKALFTVDEKNNRRASYWCDDCQQMQSRSNISRHRRRQHEGKKRKIYNPPDRAMQIRLIREAISKGYKVFCVLCNGTYTTEQWTLIHIHSRSHVTRGGKNWKRNLGEPAWKLRSDAGHDKECSDDDTEGEPLIISPKLFNRKRKRSNETASEATVKRPKRAATKDVVMDYDLEEAQDTTDDELYKKEKIKGTIKKCTVNINKLDATANHAQPAKVSNRPIRNSNEDNLQTISSIDFEADNLNFEADTSDDYDNPNNCYSPEDFHQNKQVLINVVNTMINKFESKEFQPFYVERTVEEGLRAGTWALNKYKSIDGNSHYIVVKVNDNNRILQSKEIPSMCFFPSITPAKNGKDETNVKKPDNINSKDIEQEAQTVIEEEIKNEYDTEIKVECGEEESEQDYEAYTVQITPGTEDAVADEQVSDAN